MGVIPYPFGSIPLTCQKVWNDSSSIQTFGDLGADMLLSCTKGSIRFKHNDGIAQVSYAEAGLEPNRWHHVVGVFDQTHLRLYVDGVLKATTPYTLPQTFKEDVALRIGCRTHSPSRRVFHRTY